MFNLLKADVYRLFKTRSYYIVGVILGVFATLLMYSLGDMVNNGATDLGFNPINPELTDLVYQVLLNTLIVLIIGIEAAVYICTDFSSEYIKNIASSVNRKTTIAISKFIALTIGIGLYLLFIILVTYIFGNVFIGNVMIHDVSRLSGYVGMVFFLTLVMVGLVILVSSLFRNSATSITTLVLVVLLASFVYSTIQQFLGIDLTSISPIMNYQILTPSNTDSWMKIILSGLGFMATYLGTSAILMEKKDII